MARVRRKLSGGGNYKRWANWEEGDYIIGKYVKEGIDRTYGKPQYTIEIEEAHMSNPVYESPAGKEIVAGTEITLNSAGGLDKTMGDIEIGTILEIVYEGTEVLPDGHKFKGKEAHQISVYECGDDDDDEGNDL